MRFLCFGRGRPNLCAAVMTAAFACAVLLTTAGTAGAVTVEQWNTPGGKYVNRKDEFPVDLVKGKLVTNVVLPNGYSSRPCWPVLYLLHGTADSTSTSASLQWLQIDHGALLSMGIPAILVIPGSGDTWWTNEWWNGNRHPAYESWLLQSVLPMVQKRLHVCPGRSEHAIAGLSMGGYGAIMLAAQRPDYFGSASSFSGVLSPESPNFVTVYKQQWSALWGPPGGFYALGHDPMALVDNLRSTRVFVGVGNGVPTPGETSSPVAVFEETEFDQEDRAFVAKARGAHVSVTFDQHQGTHDALNWIQTLSRMMAWDPFRHGIATPSRWVFYTADESGSAWGYQFSFDRHSPPKQLIEFAYANHVLTVRGGGRVAITTPGGAHIAGVIPFRIRQNRLTELSRAPAQPVTGGYRKIVPITPTANQSVRSEASPVTVSFSTAQRLPSNLEYSVVISAYSLSGAPSNCSATAEARIPDPGARHHVRVSVSPPATATNPNRWCSGEALVALTEVPKTGPPELGTILGYGPIAFP